MHYKNGREVKIGDSVVGKDYQGLAISGIVVTASPGSTSCNIGIVPGPANIHTHTAGEFLHIDDVLPKPEGEPS